MDHLCVGSVNLIYLGTYLSTGVRFVCGIMAICVGCNSAFTPPAGEAVTYSEGLKLNRTETPNIEPHYPKPP